MEVPFKRSKVHPRFRLIDFGRSTQVDENQSGVHEEFVKANEDFDLRL